MKWCHYMLRLLRLRSRLVHQTHPQVSSPGSKTLSSTSNSQVKQPLPATNPRDSDMESDKEDSHHNEEDKDNSEHDDSKQPRERFPQQRRQQP
eukprot:g83458.t1